MEAWQFFSDPRNLDEITPDDLGFRTEPMKAGPMYEGQIIVHQVKVLPFVWIDWVTEIKCVEDGEVKVFIDEQRFGPYKFWHHRHEFRAIDGGTEMRDHVRYILNFGPIGQLVHRLFVGKKLQWVFENRRSLLETHFGLMEASTKQDSLGHTG